MKIRKKIISFIAVFAMTATIFMPSFGFAASDTEWDLPTTSMSVEKNSATNKDVVTVGAHAAASTIVHYLGGNLVTDRSSDITGNAKTDQGKLDYAKTNTEIGAFGTSVNDSPDPYFWNYAYNLHDAINNGGNAQSSDTLALVNANPFGADTTLDSSTAALTKSGNGVSKTIAKMPDILLGLTATTNSYDSQISDLKVNNDEDTSNDYSPTQMKYSNTNLDDCISKMYELAGDIVKSGKSGRYDTASSNTMDIAKNYESYIKGLQLYVQSEINAGTVDKRTVAVIDPSTLSDSTYQAYNSSMAKGTAASTRAAEYVENTTNNIIDTCKIKNSGSESSPMYYATAKQLASADAIFITVQAQINYTAEEFAQELADVLNVSVDSLPPIYASDPNGAFSIRANSVENFVGVGQYQAFVYPELLDAGYAATYVYQNFYHVSGTTNLDKLTRIALAKASLRDGQHATADGYTKDYIDSKINQGLAYYNTHKSEFENTKLAPTDNLDTASYSTTNIKAASVSGLTSQKYTGSEIKPGFTLTLNGEELTKGVDYTVMYYRNNVEPGTAIIKVKGINWTDPTNSKNTRTHSGERIIKFNITGSINGATAAAAKVVYTGKALSPAVSLKLGDKTLKNGIDYTVAFSNNTKVGKKAVATFTGKGDYDGTKSVNFTVSPKKASIKKLTKAKKAFKVRITSQKTSGVKTYQISYKVKGAKKYKTIKTNSTKKTIKKLKAKKTYYVKVRAYKATNGSTVPGAWSKTKTVKTK